MKSCSSFVNGARKAAWNCTLIVGLMAVAFTTATGGNETCTVVLHVDPVAFDCLNGPLPFDCVSSSPTVVVKPGQVAFIHVFLRNYEVISAFQCRFAVDGASGPQTWGDWMLISASFGCLPGQISQVPVQSASPPFEPGEMATSFNCVTGGVLVPLGWMLLRAGSTGCLGIEEHQFDTAVQDCVSKSTPIASVNRGRVCISAGGYDACNPAPVAVDNTTWGIIKSQFN